MDFNTFKQVVKEMVVDYFPENIEMQMSKYQQYINLMKVMKDSVSEAGFQYSNSIEFKSDV